MHSTKRYEVENDLVESLAAFEDSFPDARERAAAVLALCRRLATIVATKAKVTAAAAAGREGFQDARARKREVAWLSLLYALDTMPQCELCGGSGLCIARVESTERGSLPGLGVPCPACGDAPGHECPPTGLFCPICGKERNPR